MRIAIYHPNLNMFGGGETVALTIAGALSKEHDVDILTPYEVDKKKLEDFFCINLKRVSLLRIGSPLTRNSLFRTLTPSILLKQTYPVLEKYDVVIDTCTNGWFDTRLNTKTVCYVHYPFFFKKKKWIKSILNRFIP